MNDMLTQSEAAEMLGVPRRTLQYWRDTKQGPPYARLGKRIIRYRRADVEAFIQSASK